MTNQEIAVREQGCSGPGSVDLHPAAPAWQPQGTPEKESPLLHGREAVDVAADNGNGTPSEVLQISVLYSKIFAERRHRNQNTRALLTVREKDMRNQGNPF